MKVSEDNIMAVIGKKYSLYIYAFQGISSTLLVTIIKSLKPYRIGTFLSVLYKTGKPFAVFFTAFALALIYTSIANLIKKPFQRKKAES
jgi:hypothetical protein